MEQIRLIMLVESRIRGNVYVRFGGEFLKTSHSNMERRWELSLLKGPVMPIDPYSQLAFVEILNILLTAGHIVDVNRFLISRNVNPQFGSLSGYFRWSFAGDHFTLWQRTDYNSTLCFNHRILDLPFGVLAAKDSGKDKETAN